MNIQIPGIQAALTEETDRRHPERTEGILKDFGKFLEEADTMQHMNKTARMLEHDFIKYSVFMGSMAGCSDSDRTEWAYNRKKQMMQ